MDKINISVFFPCYNEENNIGKLLNSILEFLPTISDDFEIIVIDDGSTDATAEIAQKIAMENSQVKVIRISHVERKGKSV